MKVHEYVCDGKIGNAEQVGWGNLKKGNVVLFIDEIDGLGSRRDASDNTWEITFS